MSFRNRGSLRSKMHLSKVRVPQGANPALPTFQYASTEREVSLLIPDRQDAPGDQNDSNLLELREVMSGPPRLTIGDRLHLRRMASERVLNFSLSRFL